MPPRRKLKEPPGTLSGEAGAHGMGDAGARLEPGEYRLSLWFCKGNDLILAKRRPSTSTVGPRRQALGTKGPTAQGRHLPSRRPHLSPRPGLCLTATGSGTARLIPCLHRARRRQGRLSLRSDCGSSHAGFRGRHSRSALLTAPISTGHTTALQDAKSERQTPRERGKAKMSYV